MLEDKPGPDSTTSGYLGLFRNRSFALLWSGETVSTFGDAFFNLAVMWVVYTQSGSALQTAIVQVVFQLSDVIFAPLAGILAGRWDRKRIMVTTNVLAAVVVAALAAIMSASGDLSPVVVFVTVFVLNSLTAFLKPARDSMMPQVVGRGMMATAAGLFSSVKQAASFLGNAVAGVVIAAVSAAWAVAIDALSFVFVALCITAARLPGRIVEPSSSGKGPSLRRELVDGWRVISGRPVVRAMVWLGMLVNVSSFMGPLYPALVDQRLNAGAAAFGAIEAAAVVGGVVGGALAGKLERRFGAGHLLVAGWGLAGLCTLGIAASTSVALTAALEAAMVFGLVAGSVSMGAATVVLVPEEYRGRVSGITVAMSVFAIPASALLGGFMADVVGVAPMFAFGGIYLLGVAALAGVNRHVRTVRL